MNPRAREALVRTAAALLAVATLVVGGLVVVGAATYDAPPPMLTAEQVRAITRYQHDNTVVIVDKDETAMREDDARRLARQIDRPGGEFGAVLRGLSLAAFDDGGRWAFDLVWVAYLEDMRFPCLGPSGACTGEVVGEPGFILYDAETLTQIGGATL